MSKQDYKNIEYPLNPESRRAEVFSKLEEELRKKNISQDAIRDTEEKSASYLESLQERLDFDLSISLKRFFDARR